MDILYEQLNSRGLLGAFGIDRCFFKHLYTEQDSSRINMKPHFHTDYELIILNTGSMIYESEGTVYPMTDGQFLLHPPGSLHRVIHRAPQTSSIGISLHISRENPLLPAISTCICGTLTDRMRDNLRQILSESSHRQKLSSRLIAGNIWETLVLVWRLCGMEDAPAPIQVRQEESRLAIAKQYIYDNIELAPTVSEVSAHCHLSAKQLTRLFLQSDGTTPADYIRKVRIRHIETLLQSTCLSLQAISNRMHFSNEYYFNTYFKKYAGMTPGRFRAMHKTQ